MASTFGSLEIAKSGMMAYNAALQTTAHNVANIETKGYSKQTVNTVSYTHLDVYKRQIKFIVFLGKGVRKFPIQERSRLGEHT